MTTEFQILNIKDIAPAKVNYRRSCTEKGMKELTASIKANGILQPVLVRTLKKGKGAAFEMVAGSRRYKAAKDAQLTQIPAMVRDLTDVQVLEIQVIENDHREDTDPIDQAYGYKALLDKGTWTPEMLALKIDKSVRFVTERIRLTELNKKVQAALVDGKIMLGHALLMTRLKNPDDQTKVLSLVTGAHMSVKALESAMSRFSQDLTAAVFDVSVACDDCDYNSKNQNILFPELAKGPSECMDTSCFTSRTRSHYENVIESKDAAGFRALSKKTDVFKIIPENNTRTNTACFIGPKADWKTVAPDKFKTTCSKCKEHHVYFFYEEPKSYAGPFVFGEICTNRPCLDTMNNKGKTTGGEGSDDDNDNSDHDPELSTYARQRRVNNCIGRFSLSAVISALTVPREDATAGSVLAKITIRERFILWLLLDYIANSNTFNDNSDLQALITQIDPDFTIGEDDYFEDKKIYSLLAKVQIGDFSSAHSKIIDAVIAAPDSIDDEVLSILAKDTGITIADEIVVDEEYLRELTIKELTAYAAQCGIDFPQDADKDSLIALILNEAVRPLPAEIATVLRGEEITAEATA